jgi:ABC-type phosphate transport system substrate-binding protein
VRRLIILLLLLASGALIFTALPLGTSQGAGFPPQGRAGVEDCLAIVVNRSNPVESLSFTELRKIFLGDPNHWSNGRRITVVMLEPGKVERQVVLSQIYQMDEKDFNRYFLHSMFTGELHAAPKSLATSSDVLKFVFNVPGAIGYLKASDVDDSVKIVRIDSRLPGDKEYAIRLHGKPVNSAARPKS